MLKEENMLFPASDLENKDTSVRICSFSEYQERV